MKLKRWLKSPWVISVGSAVFSLILTMIYDYAKAKPIFSSIGTILRGIFSGILIFLNFNIKVWWILVAIIGIIMILYVMYRINSKVTPPQFHGCREDRLKKWKWTWAWSFDKFENKWHVSNLTAHCPNCDNIA